jgi:hypothetical protein
VVCFDDSSITDIDSVVCFDDSSIIDIDSVVCFVFHFIARQSNLQLSDSYLVSFAIR